MVLTVLKIARVLAGNLSQMLKRAGQYFQGAARIGVAGAVVASALYAPCAIEAARAEAKENFAAWVSEFWPQASKYGISEKTFRRAFRGVRPDPEVLRAAEHQPEFVKPIWEYLSNAVSDFRIKKGRQKLARYSRQFAAIEKKYGVDRHYLAAIWGIESSYGSFKGTKYVIRSLATLAYTGTRKEFGRTQLLAALRILESGDIDPAHMKGSWAGAMGHTQFIPTTYHDYAVDFTGDGTRDIWRSISDALASTANFLKQKGWREGETWGYEVILPKDFDYGLADHNTVKTLREWARLGVRRVGKRAFPRPEDEAQLIVPAGAKGPAFLVINNFHVIKRYNNSTAYALAVGHLADRLMGFGPIVQPWPKDIKPLTRAEQEELQRLLAARGFLRGKIDGIIGPATKAAVRAYQRSNRLVPDGFPTKELLESMRHDAGQRGGSG